VSCDGKSGQLEPRRYRRRIFTPVRVYSPRLFPASALPSGNRIFTSGTTASIQPLTLATLRVRLRKRLYTGWIATGDERRGMFSQKHRGIWKALKGADLLPQRRSFQGAVSVP
jgi:hypothetical protein